METFTRSFLDAGIYIFKALVVSYVLNKYFPQYK